MGVDVGGGEERIAWLELDDIVYKDLRHGEDFGYIKGRSSGRCDSVK